MAAACRASSHSTLRTEARQRESRVVTRGRVGKGLRPMGGERRKPYHVDKAFLPSRGRASTGCVHMFFRTLIPMVTYV
ncbi:hypothetical protein D3C87_534990 [compost metagenome]